MDTYSTHLKNAAHGLQFLVTRPPPLGLLQSAHQRQQRLVTSMQTRHPRHVQVHALDCGVGNILPRAWRGTQAGDGTCVLQVFGGQQRVDGSGKHQVVHVELAVGEGQHTAALHAQQMALQVDRVPWVKHAYMRMHGLVQKMRTLTVMHVVYSASCTTVNRLPSGSTMPSTSSVRVLNAAAVPAQCCTRRQAWLELVVVRLDVEDAGSGVSGESGLSCHRLTQSRSSTSSIRRRLVPTCTSLHGQLYGQQTHAAWCQANVYSTPCTSKTYRMGLLCLKSRTHRSTPG